MERLGKPVDTTVNLSICRPLKHQAHFLEDFMVSINPVQQSSPAIQFSD